MAADLVAMLRHLAAEPDRLSALTPEQAAALTTHLEGVLGGQTPGLPAASPPASGEDQLLTADEVASLLRTSTRFVYRHARNWPFTRRISRKCLRFDRVGLMHYLAKKRL